MGEAITRADPGDVTLYQLGPHGECPEKSSVQTAENVHPESSQQVRLRVCVCEVICLDDRYLNLAERHNTVCMSALVLWLQIV